MYKLDFTQRFIQIARKYKHKNNKIKDAIEGTLDLLASDPKNPALRSHKVSSRLFGECWSSRVTGDIRIIWKYAEDTIQVISILDIGSHSGSKKVYS